MKKFLAVLAVVAIVAFAAPAFAANPFMDVPAGHWSYDAVAQLAARGVVSGYPDGAFKGAQPATRYEMASVVARALAKVDAEKASKQDLEMLKKLVMEFKDELDALGVKVNKIDKRVAVLEDRLGGWKLRGILVFDAKFADSDKDDSNWTSTAAKNEFTKEKFRLYFSKQIDENTSFNSEFRYGAWAKSSTKKGMGDTNEMSTQRAWVQTKLPYDIKFRVGRFGFDWEGDNGLYTDEDATFGDWRVDGFEFKKSFGNLTGTAIIGRNASGEKRNDAGFGNFDSMLYGLNLNWTPNEKFFGGLMGYWQKGDLETAGAAKPHLYTYAVNAGFKFTPAVELKGIYYWQKNSFENGAVLDDSAKSWKAILDIKQDLLKFTSLWIEYSQEDNNFGGNNDQNWVARYSFGTYSETGVLNVRPHNNQTSKYWFIKAEQKWNKKWGSFVRFVKADWDTAGLDDAQEWGVGVKYQYTPAIAFMLAYDSVDYGDQGRTKEAATYGKDNLVIFRTTVKF
ncbi:MAG: S-layer homology domain-containing protein [Synergistaceae bacterium]